jgi:Zn-finger nucleic acid-binding protein
MVYEGSAIIECPVCGGVGATRPQVEAILARRDWGFTPEQERVADMIERYQASLLQPDGQGGRRPRLSLPWPTEASESSCCPFCETPMRRAPWSLAYPLPTDFCGPCDLHWFGHDEIEVLQILVERQID